MPDATVAVDDVTAPVVFVGAAVTDAFRFWFDRPGLKLLAHEAPGARGPALSITYRVP